MPREVEISNIEKSFILEALSQDVRLDGRSLDQWRNLELEFGQEYGTATLRLGKTRYGPSMDLTFLKSNRIFQGTRADICRSDQATGRTQV